MPKLTLEDATSMIRATQRVANSLGLKITTAVVDGGGRLMALERQDNAVPISLELSQLKAASAFLTKRKTGELAKPHQPGMEMYGVQFVSGITVMEGGEPIIAEGDVIGGIGVSGAKSHDDECALAGVDYYFRHDVSRNENSKRTKYSSKSTRLK